MRSDKPNAAMSLYETLWKHYNASENYYGQKFICMETVERELSYDRVLQWSKNHPLHRDSERQDDDETLIKRLLTNARLLFAMLVIARLEYLTPSLLNSGWQDETLFDATFFDEGCYSAGLEDEERHSLARIRKRVGALLRNDVHQVFSNEIVLPYRNVNHPEEDRFGGLALFVALRWQTAI